MLETKTEIGYCACLRFRKAPAGQLAASLAAIMALLSKLRGLFGVVFLIGAESFVHMAVLVLQARARVSLSHLMLAVRIRDAPA